MMLAVALANASRLHHPVHTVIFEGELRARAKSVGPALTHESKRPSSRGQGFAKLIHKVAEFAVISAN